MSPRNPISSSSSGRRNLLLVVVLIAGVGTLLVSTTSFSPPASEEEVVSPLSKQGEGRVSASEKGPSQKGEKTQENSPSSKREKPRPPQRTSGVELPNAEGDDTMKKNPSAHKTESTTTTTTTTTTSSHPWSSPDWDPSPKDRAKSVRSLPKCRALGSKFTTYLDTWLDVVGRTHQEQVEKKKKQKSSSSGEEGKKRWSASGGGKIVHNCESNKIGRFCGGAGDRFRGMITTFFLALITKRQYFIYQPFPAPLQEMLRPHLFNWVPPAPIETSVESIPIDTQLMALKKHRSFVSKLEKTNPSADLRLQSNSFGIDPFLYNSKVFSKVLKEEMGLGIQCNMTGYFGCLYDVLFTPTMEFREEIDRVFAAARKQNHQRQEEDDDTGAAGNGGRKHSSTLISLQNTAYLSVQLRIGGSWAKGMRIPEPFRTPPEWLPFFYNLVKELRSGKVSKDLVPNAEKLKDCLIFVSSDAERVVTEFQKEFGKENIMFVPGAYNHTDTQVLGGVKGTKKKYDKEDPAEVKAAYRATLVSHYLLGRGAHIVMAQSGFGDTAYWMGRQSASSIFVDMNKPKLGWQHHSGYSHLGEEEEEEAEEGGGEGTDQTTKEESRRSKLGLQCGSTATMNRIVTTKQKSDSPFYLL